MSLRRREDEAAWAGWTEGVRKGENCMALMRRIIAAVDQLRAKEALRDRDERTRGD